MLILKENVSKFGKGNSHQQGDNSFWFLLLLLWKSYSNESEPSNLGKREIVMIKSQPLVYYANGSLAVAVWNLMASWKPEIFRWMLCFWSTLAKSLQLWRYEFVVLQFLNALIISEMILNESWQSEPYVLFNLNPNHYYNLEMSTICNFF